ncbi:hypothetical protein RFI_15268 [Reticulomyxa filosa]|uniref:Uncharacterized protein n=1 Tax=Reticulomyxa filosa TaxID=46433 RepID=X6N6P7_RETFI|nr:hypothetical protein RFI_15268 [Reticulomyxa filosa]|eukprot:ETO21935.1 hypothetical protein RFI_15268 [Reticulomyxa filosa]
MIIVSKKFVELLLLSLGYLIWCLDCTLGLKQCCADPVDAIMRRQFESPCATHMYSDRFERLRDWIELNGGYIHPSLAFKQISGEKGNRNLMSTAYIPPKTLLMDIPFKKTTFSEYLIEQYLDDLPKDYPKSVEEYWAKYKEEEEGGDLSKIMHPRSEVQPWLALGLAWLMTYTDELLPHLYLLPSYEEMKQQLPFLWHSKLLLSSTLSKSRVFHDYDLLKGTEAYTRIQDLQFELNTTRRYLSMLGLEYSVVEYAFGIVVSRSFGLPLHLLPSKSITTWNHVDNDNTYTNNNNNNNNNMKMKFHR